MEDINLHFTGDFTLSPTTCSALADNHIYWGNALGSSTYYMAWRSMDMNDRALRSSSTRSASPPASRETGSTSHFSFVAAVT
jgi:formyltetrahydrofolate synthetase